jgi:hypothetical protein
LWVITCIEGVYAIFGTSKYTIKVFGLLFFLKKYMGPNRAPGDLNRAEVYMPI